MRARSSRTIAGGRAALSGCTSALGLLASCTLGVLAGCTIAGPSPSPPRTHPSWPTLQSTPTRAPDPASDAEAAYWGSPSTLAALPHAVVPGYNSRVVALRTSLGRAAIKLEMRTPARQTIRSSVCTDPDAPQRGCSVCELAGETDELDSAVLDALVIAFDRYPTGVLEATHIEKVALCTKLSYEDIEDHGTIGTIDIKERRLVISLAPFVGEQYDANGDTTTEDIVHHELFHLVEYERMRGFYNDDPEWRVYNPIDFRYVEDGWAAAGELRPKGFVDPYATSAEIEDKASVYQYMMARPQELCEIEKADSIVRKKVELIGERIAAITDDSFLKSRARCGNAP